MKLRTCFSVCDRLAKMLLLSVLIFSTSSVCAKQKKGTDEPSENPSAVPSSSMFPSSVPTELPSSTPTMAPTKEPTTPLPTEPATPAPTVDPSASPTGSSTQTNAPTSSPTSSTTKTSTLSPTESEATVVSVRLPTLGIDVVVSDKDGASQTVDGLELEMTAFVEDMLERNSGTHSFDYASLEFDVILSSFDRRRLDTGLSIEISGTVYFGTDGPSPDDLTANIRNYFLVWGIDDLETYLQMVGLPSSKIASVTIDGETVKTANRIQGYNPGAHIEKETGELQEDSTVSAGIIAGLVVSCVVVLLAIAFIVFRTRHKSQGSGRSRRSRSAASNWADSDTVVAIVGPKTSGTQSGEHSDEEEDAHSIGAISMDMSLYTTDESIARPNSYDAKRLDKVIEIARKHSDLSQERVDI